MATSVEQARKELARRELARRQAAVPVGEAPVEPMTREQMASMSGRLGSSELPLNLPETLSGNKDRGIEDFGQGVAVSGIGTYLGIKDLMGKASDSEKQSYADLKADAKESGWGTGGRVAGELAQLAIPGALGIKLYRALSAANQARKAAKLLPLAADVAGSAALGATRLPGEGETRGESARDEAKWALAGGVIEPVLRTAVAGVKGTREAARLRDMGVPLTAGQMVGGRGRQMENIVGIMPFGAKPIDKARAAADEGIRRVAIREAAPPTPQSILTPNPQKAQVSTGGREARAQLEKAYDEGYAAAFTTFDRLAPNTSNDLLGVAVDGIDGLTKQGRRTVEKAMKDMDALVAANPSISVAQLDKVLRDNILGKTKTRETDTVLAQMRSVLRQGQPAPNQAALQALDESYPNFIAVRNAIATPKAAKAGGDFGLDELATGSRQAANPYTRGTDKQPMMQFLDDANAARGIVPTVLPTTSRRIIQALPDPLGLVGFTNRRIAGTGAGQQTAREILESELAKQLRYGVSGARLGAAYEE